MFDKFDLVQAIYWYCNHYHGGQNSREYEILSTIQYSPGMLENHPNSEMAWMLYNQLESGEANLDELYRMLLA